MNALLKYHSEPLQVYLVVVVAMLIGGIFGCIFGILDVEDEVRYHIRLALLKEEHYCCPIGGLLGGIVSRGCCLCHLNAVLVRPDSVMNTFVNLRISFG